MSYCPVQPDSVWAEPACLSSPREAQCISTHIPTTLLQFSRYHTAFAEPQCLAVAILMEQAAKQSFHLCGILFWQHKGGANWSPQISSDEHEEVYRRGISCFNKSYWAKTLCCPDEVSADRAASCKWHSEEVQKCHFWRKESIAGLSHPPCEVSHVALSTKQQRPMGRPWILGSEKMWEKGTFMPELTAAGCLVTWRHCRRNPT